MPSSRAVAAPSTATGSRAVAAFRNWPCARLVPATAGRPRVAASTLRRVGFDRGDERGLVDVDAADGAGVLHRGDAGQPGDHARRRLRQLGGAAGEGLPVGDGQQVGAQRLDLGQQRGGGGGGQAQDGDDRRDADRDAQRRQPGAQLAGPQPDAGQRGQVPGPQPGRGRGRRRPPRRCGGHDGPSLTAGHPPPAAGGGRVAGTGLVSAMMCPSSISMRRRVRAATAWSWVMMMTVVPAG